MTTVNRDSGQEQSRYITRSIPACWSTSTSENASVEVDVLWHQYRSPSLLEKTRLDSPWVPVAKILKSVILMKWCLIELSFQPAYITALQRCSERVEDSALVSNRAQNLLKRIEAGQGQKSPSVYDARFPVAPTLPTFNAWLPWFELTISNTKLPTHELYSKLKQFEAQVMALTPAIPDECFKIWQALRQF